MGSKRELDMYSQLQSEESDFITRTFTLQRSLDENQRPGTQVKWSNYYWKQEIFETATVKVSYLGFCRYDCGCKRYSLGLCTNHALDLLVLGELQLVDAWATSKTSHDTCQQKQLRDSSSKEYRSWHATSGHENQSCVCQWIISTYFSIRLVTVRSTTGQKFGLWRKTSKKPPLTIRYDYDVLGSK